MAAALKLQSYGSNFKTAILWIQLYNRNLVASTLDLASNGCTFKTAIFWLQL